MIEHPRARSHITLNEFIYIQGKRAVLGSLALEFDHYHTRGDFDSCEEVLEEFCIIKNEYQGFVDAVNRSDEYHRRRKDV